mgnify:CR=1 FL=1
MAFRISQIGNDQFFDQNGLPAVGYKLFTYLEGTTTKADTFTDIDGLAKHTNPIILNAMGFPPASIFLNLARKYKFVLTGPKDTDPPTSALYTWDGISSEIQLEIRASAEFIQGPQPTYVSGTSFTLPGDTTSFLTPGRRVRLLSSAGTHLGTIETATFTTPDTTVTIINDTGALDPSITDFFFAFLSSSGSAVPDVYFDGLETIFVGPVNLPPTASFSLIPAGFISEYAGTIAPVGYLFADGASLLRADFPALFAALGTTFGSVDADTFNIPDLRGTFPLGKDDMGGVAAGRVTAASVGGVNSTILGGRGGEQAHALIAAENGPHTHTYQAPGAANSVEVGSPQILCFSAGAASTTDSSGSGTPHSTTPPWLCLNYIIRAY